MNILKVQKERATRKGSPYELVVSLDGTNQLVTAVYHEATCKIQAIPDSSPIRCEFVGNDALLPIRKSLECCNQQYGLLTTVVPLHVLIAEHRYPPYRGGNTEYLVPVIGMQGKGSEKPLLYIKEAFMKQRNVNRLVWNNGFTNDRQATQNREAYQKTCDKCQKKIWLNPEGSGWKAIDSNGNPHECKKKKARKERKEPKHYVKDCKFCGQKIVVMLMAGKKWVAFDQNRTKHRCKGKGGN
jgi:hypothetical protein